MNITVERDKPTTPSGGMQLNVALVSDLTDVTLHGNLNYIVNLIVFRQGSSDTNQAVTPNEQCLGV